MLDDEQVLARCAQASARGEIALECRPCAGVQWQEAALAELGLAHNEAVIGEILALQRERLGDAQARGSQEPEQVVIRQRADGPLRRDVEGGGHDRPDLIGRQQVGCGARPPAPPERPWRRNLVAAVLGSQEGREAPGRVVAHASLPRRARRARPRVHALCHDEGIAGHRGEPDVMNEKPLLVPESKTAAALEGDVALDLGHQHAASPGQGWATSRSIGRSTLA